MIELLNIDCMEYMSGIQDGHFDLAIVDPPYGIGTNNIKDGNTRRKWKKDYKIYANGKNDRPGLEYFQDLKRVSKNQIIWGANHLCDLFDGSSPGWIVWEKETTGKFSDCELAYSSFDVALKRFRYRWAGYHQGEWIKGADREVRIHPSQKPVILYNWLLRNYSSPGQRILDTHLGSGSSAIAAHYFGVDFVGCEIDADYYAATRRRFENETRQVDLWAPSHK